MARFAMIASALGAVLSLVLIGLRQFFTGASASSVALMWVTTGLWPSSIMLMGTADKETVDAGLLAVYGASIAINALVYAAIGCGLWHGFYRSKPVLVALVALIVVSWVGLSRL